MRPNVVAIINAADASKNESSVVIPADQIYSISVQAVSTGSSTGSVQVYFSNDPINGLAETALGQPIPVNWTALGSALTVTAASVTSLGQTNVCCKWLKAEYTKNNGSAGTISVNLASQAY